MNLSQARPVRPVLPFKNKADIFHALWIDSIIQTVQKFGGSTERLYFIKVKVYPVYSIRILPCGFMRPAKIF
jgi:hypothetical protein